jgi:hypothetical protein
LDLCQTFRTFLTIFSMGCKNFPFLYCIDFVFSRLNEFVGLVGFFEFIEFVGFFEFIEFVGFFEFVGFLLSVDLVGLFGYILG